MLRFTLFLFASAVWGQNGPLQAFVDQKLIFRHLGDQASVRLQRDRLNRVTGGCDIAIQITKAEWGGGTARFQLEPIGQPFIPTKAVRNQCRTVHPQTALEVSGFARNEAPEAIAGSIGEILQTPERYLKDYGIAFNLPPGPDPEIVGLTARPTYPQPLLRVDAEYSEPARRRRTQGTVTISFVVGIDGRAHKPRVVSALGDGLDENALRALSLWRFEPGRVGDAATPLTISVQMSFRIQ